MIPLKDQEYLRAKFAFELRDPVKVDFFTQRELGLHLPGRRPCPSCKPTGEMLHELAGLSDKISLRTHIWEEDREAARNYGIDVLPAIVLRGRANHPLKFFGLPAGHEFPVFIETVVDVSRGTSLLSAESKKELRKVKKGVRLQVFVTPTCVYCPQMARAACQLALESAHVSVEVIAANEFPELARRYAISAVPSTVIDGKVPILGAVAEAVLVGKVLKVAQGASASELGEATGGPTSAFVAEESAASQPQRRGSGLIIP